MRVVEIIDEDLGIRVRTEHRHGEERRMTASVAGVDVVADEVNEEVLGRPVITEIIREPAEMTEERTPFSPVLRDGDLAVLVENIVYEGAVVPAGQVVLVITRSPDMELSSYLSGEFVNCMFIGGATIGIMSDLLMPIAYDGDTYKAQALMAKFGGMDTTMMREIGA